MISTFNFESAKHLIYEKKFLSQKTFSDKSGGFIYLVIAAHKTRPKPAMAYESERAF